MRHHDVHVCDSSSMMHSHHLYGKDMHTNVFSKLCVCMCGLLHACMRDCGYYFTTSIHANVYNMPMRVCFASMRAPVHIRENVWLCLYVPKM